MKIQDTLLHSGEFVDNNGDTVRVSFYKRLFFAVSVESFDLPAANCLKVFYIYTRGCDSQLESPVDWVEITHLSSLNHNGTTYSLNYIYVYANQTGSPRSTTLKATITDGPDAGKYIDIPLTQSA